jgi:hypothetical protein
VFDYLWTVEKESIGLKGNRKATERFAAVAEIVKREMPDDEAIQKKFTNRKTPTTTRLTKCT